MGILSMKRLVAWSALFHLVASVKRKRGVIMTLSKSLLRAMGVPTTIHISRMLGYKVCNSELLLAATIVRTGDALAPSTNGVKKCSQKTLTKH